MKVDGHPVDKWAGNMEGVRELIMLGEHDRVVFTVQRPGHEGEMEISCGFRIPETSWWQRSGMRQVGLMQAMPCVIGEVIPNSPAALAGLIRAMRLRPPMESASGTLQHWMFC